MTIVTNYIRAVRAVWPFIGMAAWLLILFTITIFLLPKRMTKMYPIKQYRRFVKGSFEQIIALSKSGPFYNFGVNLCVKIGSKTSFIVGDKLSVMPESPQAGKPSTTATEATIRWKSITKAGAFHKEEYVLEMQKGPNISKLPSTGCLAPADADSWEWVGEPGPTWKPEIAMKTSNDDEPWKEVYRGADKKATIKELEAGMWISFRVRAVNSVGDSAFSDVSSAFTKQTVSEYGAFNHAPNYEWSQTPVEVNLRLPLPDSANTRQLKCDLKSKTLQVCYNDEILIKGDLYSECISDESNWQLDSDKNKKFLVYTLRKGKDYMPWPSAIKNHPEIDVKSLQF